MLNQVKIESNKKNYRGYVLLELLLSLLILGAFIGIGLIFIERLVYAPAERDRLEDTKNRLVLALNQYFLNEFADISEDIKKELANINIDEEDNSSSSADDDTENIFIKINIDEEDNSLLSEGYIKDYDLYKNGELFSYSGGVYYNKDTRQIQLKLIITVVGNTEIEELNWLKPDEISSNEAIWYSVPVYHKSFSFKNETFSKFFDENKYRAHKYNLDEEKDEEKKDEEE